MFQFIVTTIFMVSLGVILYIAVRTLPRIDENALPEKKSVLERWIASEIPEKVDAAVNSFTVKFLRKIKVILLKVDNSLSSHLTRIKPDSRDKQNLNIDFKEIAESKNEKEKVENSPDSDNN